MVCDISLIYNQYKDQTYALFKKNNTCKHIYCIILNRSMYMDKSVLDKVVDCINNFLLCSDVIVITYNTSCIISHYKQGETMHKLRPSKSVDHSVPFFLLRFILSHIKHLKLLFITSNFFDNHYKNYNDVDIINDKITELKIYIPNLEFHVFIINDLLDTIRFMSLLNISHFTITNKNQCYTDLYEKLSDLSLYTDTIGTECVKFVDMNDKLVCTKIYSNNKFNSIIDHCKAMNANIYRLTI